MSTLPIPVVILGGSDRKAATLPDQGRDKHPLVGYKGAHMQFRGRPVIRTIVERLAASGAFEPIYIAGPAEVYGNIDTQARLIHTNGTFGENIEAAVEAVDEECPGRPVAFTTCDILPEVDTLRDLMRHYASHAPCDLWSPLIRAPKDRERLGASSWKPAYRIVEREGEAPIPTLPGHLVVADPMALRLNFIYRLFQIGYRTRNKSIRHRRGVMLRGVLFELLYQDLRHLAALRVPNLTWGVLRAALPAAQLLNEGRATRARLEDTLRRMFVKYRHRKRYPRRRIHIPIVDGLSLALDMDTVEEAQASGVEVVDRSA